MCGRYSLSRPPEQIAALFGLARAPAYTARYNIAPTQDGLVVRVRRGQNGARALEPLRWGLIPYWSDDASAGGRMINARAETVTKKEPFKSAVQRRRCLVPADGFYEWQTLGKGKRPHYIHRADGKPMAFAGLWERCNNLEGGPVESFTILTVPPNGFMRELHDRMPLILEPEDFELWLDPGMEDVERLRPLMRPSPEGVLAAYPVSPFVNSPKNEGPECMERVVTEKGPFGAPEEAGTSDWNLFG